jgi:hypothetical protein
MILPSRGRPALAWILGIASVMLSYCIFGFLVVASVLVWFAQPAGSSEQSWSRFVVEMTRQEPLGYLLGCLILAAALGILGIWLVFDRPWGRRPVSLGASAARFCLGGLLGVGLDGLLVAFFLACRWLS